MNAHIIYKNYLTSDGSQMSIGGIQTYISNLLPILNRLCEKVFIYQVSDSDFEIEMQNCVVYGLKCAGKTQRLAKSLFNFAKNNINKQDDLVIFGTDSMIVDCKGYKTIAIQHGIAWDIPINNRLNKIDFLFQYLKKHVKAYQIISRLKKVDKLVCVDYNFINWYRAIMPYPEVKLYAVPNFSLIPNYREPINDEKIRIIFARRLQRYRGAILFAEAIIPILQKHKNVEVTIAGTGPCEHAVRDRLKDYANVSYIQYNSEESISIHSKHDIAVVPTLGSEGTSLSLLEAMASTCAVICTDIGGMTNIILDGYNGLMISPERHRLTDAIEKLVIDKSMRNSIAQKAYETVACSFSLQKWSYQWEQIIND